MTPHSVCKMRNYVTNLYLHGTGVTRFFGGSCAPDENCSNNNFRFCVYELIGVRKLLFFPGKGGVRIIMKSLNNRLFRLESAWESKFVSKPDTNLPF